MYKNVLIISDNLVQCKALKEIIDKKTASFTFSTSPYSDQQAFEKELSVATQVFDLKQTEDIQQIVAEFDLVISIHCKQIFPPDLVNGTKCINIHPGYNPINRGWYPQVFAILNNTPIGATIHEIDEELDHGAIIAREFVQKDASDTSLSLYNKILTKEVELFASHIDTILSGTYETTIPEDEGNLYLKRDFNALLELDLSEELTMGDALKKLRALSHGEFRNAYFVDPETGEKVFVSLNISKANSSNS